MDRRPGGPTRSDRTLTHLTLALTRSPVVAFVTMFVFGVHTGMWATTVHTVRQRQVPLDLQGRVGSVYLLGLHGGLVVGAPIGGLLARWFGLSGPFWFAFAGSAALLIWIWPRLADLTTTDGTSPLGESRPRSR